MIEPGPQENTKEEIKNPLESKPTAKKTKRKNSE